MKKILFLFLFIPIVSLGQNTFTSVIVDTHNKPIQFANITINQSNKGTNTNDAGLFTLSDILPTDTLTISCIGYDSKNLIITDINDKIILISNAINIDEVEINSNKKNKNFRVGYYHKKTLFPNTQGGTRNTKIATFIPYQL